MIQLNVKYYISYKPHPYICFHTHLFLHISMILKIYNKIFTAQSPPNKIMWEPVSGQLRQRSTWEFFKG